MVGKVNCDKKFKQPYLLQNNKQKANMTDNNRRQPLTPDLGQAYKSRGKIKHICEPLTPPNIGQ